MVGGRTLVDLDRLIETLDHDELVRAAAAEEERRELEAGGLAEFIRQGWHVLEPTTELRWGYALDAICEHLTAVTRGEINRLLMNVPPGMMKSLSTGVFWPAWEWGPGALPELRYIGSSYSEAYATRDNRRMRDLVQSGWYRTRWPDVELTRVGEKSFSNTRTGSREGVPFTRLTGGRGHRVIVDDPHSTEAAESDADRKRAVRIFRESLPTRLVDPETSAIVVIMQRLHVGDVSGEILAGDHGYEHLMLPMEYEPARRCVTSIGFEDPRTGEGELLFPERFSRSVVERDKAILGSYAAAGQFQQRPAPRGGGVVKEAWLSNRWRVRGEAPELIVQSWDCASKPQERNDPSACLTVAKFPDHYEAWHYEAGRREFPDLVRRARDLAADWKPHAILIEDKDAGQQLVQQLTRDTNLPVIPCNPGSLDKVTRLEAETPVLEAGQLWLPDDAPWVAAFVAELTNIPVAPHDESGDTLSQALRWLRERAGSQHHGFLSVRKPSGRL